MRIRHFLLLICVVVIFAATASAQGVQSIYTKVNGNRCKTVEEDEEAAGYMLQRCPGVAGYKLQVSSQDLRQGLAIIKPDGSEHELNVGIIGGGSFSFLGDKAEWRVKRLRGKLVPVALIVRFSVARQMEDGSSKDIPYLTVTKITPQKICLVKTVAPGPNANVEARRLADASADKPCYDGLAPGDPE
jgi:hypothetical protein